MKLSIRQKVANELPLELISFLIRTKKLTFFLGVLSRYPFTVTRYLDRGWWEDKNVKECWIPILILNEPIQLEWKLLRMLWIKYLRL